MYSRAGTESHTTPPPTFTYACPSFTTMVRITVLRGGSRGPNYDRAHIGAAVERLRTSGVNPRVLVDCSHDNSGKVAARQSVVLDDVAAQVREGQGNLLGVMIESNLVAGRQEARAPVSHLVYGQSITDACVDFATTERMLEGFAVAVRSRPGASRYSGVRRRVRGGDP